MNLRTALFTTLLALAAGLAPEARACPGAEPPAFAGPSFIEPTAHSAIARPLALKVFTDQGVRYWRAAYDVVARARPGAPIAPRLGDEPRPERVVVEWSCDAQPEGPDLCGQALARALPGFSDSGRPDSTFVQLELRYRHTSGFDGVDLFYAARHGSMRLPEPPALARGGVEGDGRKC